MKGWTMVQSDYYYYYYYYYYRLYVRPTLWRTALL